MEFIVGTVIGAIPLIREASKCYSSLSDTVKTFHNYQRKFKTLDTTINGQKALFRNAVNKVLTAITKEDPIKALDLMSDNDKDQFQKLKFVTIHDRNRLDSLQETFRSWTETLKMVHSVLEDTCLEVESFRPSSTATASQSTQLKTAIKQIPKRVSMSYSIKDVWASIGKLRGFNTDFDRLSTQIRDELGEMQRFTQSIPTREVSIQQRASQFNSLEKYRQIRSASSQIYSNFAIRWSCSQHRKHAASLSLPDRERILQTQSRETSDSIKFDVTISCDGDSPTAIEAPIWLEIESVGSCLAGSGDRSTREGRTQQKSQSDENREAVMNDLLRHSGPVSFKKFEKVHKKLVKKSVHFQPTASNSAATACAEGAGAGTLMVVHAEKGASARYHEGEASIAISTTSTNKTSGSIIDLNEIEDFCQHFQILRPIVTDTYVGYIKNPDLQRFYILPPERRLSGEQKSLAEVISWISEDQISRSLPKTVMARLASSLAASVLQYHSTPWLPETWQSSDVRFFGIGELTQDTNDISFTSPYFQAEFSKPSKGKGIDLSQLAINSTVTSTPSVAATNSSTPSATLDPARYYPLLPSTLARNELLFRFGIVLLELGYSRPWPSLQLSMRATLPTERLTDYQIAVDLTRTNSLRDRMGPRFPKIVRKCLGCDFGLGENDLANEELQAAFLVDVVEALQDDMRGLQELEERFQNGRGGNLR